jgi:diguanylate cyclase (GGDEF)-like protein
MRLLERKDASLAIALVAGALVIFRQPLHMLIDVAHGVELRYGIDLLPGLVLLIGAFAFHAFRKRQETKALAEQVRTQAALAAAEVTQERRHSAELERLVALGRALGSALDTLALRQVFWRYFPAFALDRELWALTRTKSGWDNLLRDAAAPALRTTDTLGLVATAALSAPSSGDTQAEGILVGDDVCFPMVVGNASLGVVGVRNVPLMLNADRRALGAAVSLLAIAIRNVQLLTQTRESSVRDQLTGCFNRAYAIEALGSELQRSRRTGRPLSVMMFDVDQLKRINDDHGHLAGDALLAAVAGQVTATLRASDIKCRWGGDEFLIILPDTPRSGAEHAGASLTREVSTVVVPTPSSGLVSPTISVGVAVAENGECDPLALVARADAALYKAKQAGRNRFVMAQSNVRVAS